MTLQDQVSALKDGDEAMAIFEYKDGKATYVGSIRLHLGAVFLDFAYNKTIRLFANDKYLTAVTVIDPPLPPEPEVGSFARLKDESIALHEVENENTPDANGSGWTITNDENWYTWTEIYPQIKKMWDKDGNEVAL